VGPARRILLSIACFSIACAPTARRSPEPQQNAAVATPSKASPISSPRSPETPAAASAAVPESTPAWSQRLQKFYAALAKGSAARMEAYRGLFAPDVRRFIALKNVPLSRVIRASNDFFRGKKDVKYVFDPASLTVSFAGPETKITFLLNAAWSTPVPPEWEDWVKTDGWLSPVIEHDPQLSVELIADETGRVVEYSERRVVRRFRVTDAEASIPAFLEPQRAFLERPAENEVERLKAGTQVEYLDRYVLFVGAGPDCMREVRVGGERYWVLEISYFKIYPPEGGSHTDATEYLQRIE
jgi:hypothetical protein